MTLNPDDLQVTSFSPAPGEEVEPSDDTTTAEGQTQYQTCNRLVWTCGCGTNNGCTSPRYAC